MSKTVLFVTYGGGHAPMVAPVIRALEGTPDLIIKTVALTLAGPYFKRQGLPFLGFKDFMTADDAPAMAWGKTLAAKYHQPETGIEEEEAVAYLGMSYWDLVLRHGEEEAARLWAQKGRNAFLPVTMMERIIEVIRPDLVVTTNSPRAEQAAVMAANAKGIPTLAMYDLLGLINFYKIEADYVAVISQKVAENIERDTGIHSGQQFLITGNPAFDQAFDYRGPINYVWRREHFPALPDTAKALLWIDEIAYIDPKTGLAVEHSAAAITRNLDALAQATKANNGYLLIRPHPSQQRAVFEEWMSDRQHPHVFFAGHVPLYPLLNASDAVAHYQSTVGCETLLMERPLIEITDYPGCIYLPLSQWGLARAVPDINELTQAVGESFNVTYAAQMRARVAELFPREKAAPKVAQAIKNIVFSVPGDNKKPGSGSS